MSSSDRSIRGLNLSTRAINYCMNKGLETESDLIAFYQSNGCSIPAAPNAGAGTIKELVQKCQAIIAGEDVACDSAENELASLGMSSRAYRYCLAKGLTSKSDLVKDYLINGKRFHEEPGCGRRTLHELSVLCDSFLEEDPSLAEDEEVTSRIINNMLECLPAESEEFVKSFHESRGYYPVIRIISEFLTMAEQRFINLGVDLGVFIPGTVVKEEIPTPFNLKSLPILHGFNFFDHGYYQYSLGWFKRTMSSAAPMLKAQHLSYLSHMISGKDVVVSCDPDATLMSINESEQTTLSSEFIFSLVNELIHSYLKEEDNHTLVSYEKKFCMLVHKDIAAEFDVEHFLLYFKYMCDNLPERKIFDLKEFVYTSKKYWRSEVVPDLKDRVLDVCRFVLHVAFGLDDDGDYKYTITPETIDLGVVVYRIVSESPEPLTVAQIRDSILESYPGNDFTDERLKNLMHKDSRLQYKRARNGMTTYMLKNDNIPLSIRDGIVRILSQSSTPLSSREISDYVSQFFDNATPMNVSSSMNCDTASRFHKFKGGLWGLSDKEYPAEYELYETRVIHSFESRLTELKAFLKQHGRHPSQSSADEEEVGLANWFVRNTKREEVIAVLNEHHGR